MATKKSASKKAAAKSAKPTRATKKPASKAAKASPAKAAKKRMGRPPKPEAERKAVPLSLRVTADEKAALEASAQRHGMSITALILAAVDSFNTETR